MDVASRSPFIAWFSAFVVLCLLCSSAYAIDVSFLEANANPDGTISTVSDISTSYQSTAEAALTLYASGTTKTEILDNALAYLDTTAVDPTTYNLSLLIANKTARGLYPDSELEKIRRYQNQDGGFGSIAGYDSSVLDTSYALQAMAVSGDIASLQTQLAISYLLSNQKADGSWSLGLNTHRLSTEYATAVALHALWQYRNTYSVSNSLNMAQEFLLNRRNADGTWSELNLTALAFIAILPRLSDLEAVQSGIDFVRAELLSDKSWNDDVYTTALMLRVIEIAENPVPNPDLGSVQGKIINAETGEALAGYTVSLTGVTSDTTVTDASGAFRFDAMVSGLYQVELSAAGFGGFTSSVVIDAATKNVNLGTVALNPVVTQSTVTVQGIVTRQATGEPLSGVTVTANGLTATTGSDGTYSITDVPPGVVTLSASRYYYAGSTSVAEVEAGSTIVFSPSLAYSYQAPRITGTITDAATGAAIQGAKITLTGANTLQVLSASNGAYQFTGLAEGKVHVLVEMSGFTVTSTDIDLEAGKSYDFSPALLSVTLNQAVLQGVVINKENNLPIKGAVVSLYGVNSDTVQTDSQGRFRFVGLTYGMTEVAVSGEGYMDMSAGMFDIKEGDNLFVPVYMLPLGYVSPTAKVAGKVYVSGTTTPVVGAIVEASMGDEHITTLAKVNGEYEFEGIKTGAWHIRVSRTNYNPGEADFFMPSPPSNQEIGVIELTEKVRFPDLEIHSMKRVGLSSEPVNFNTTGTLSISVVNSGRYQTSSGFDVIAYYDADLNGRYNSTVDQLLGIQRVGANLLAEEVVTLDIPINAQLPFRDAPVRVRLDTKSEVAEMLEDNNDGSTCELAGCGD